MAQDTFSESVKKYREWCPLIAGHSFALMIDMFFVSLCTATVLYVYNDKNWVPIYSPDDDCPGPECMDHDAFLALVNMFIFLGDTSARKLAYLIKPRTNWIEYSRCVVLLVCGSLGFCVVLHLKIGVLVPLGVFMIFFANGGLYGQATKFIDAHVPDQHNLMAFSFWLFMGDVGSLTGSNLVDVVLNNFLCTPQTIPYPHLCLQNE